MMKSKTIRLWALVAVVGLATVFSVACSNDEAKYPTQPAARNWNPVETTLVDAIIGTPVSDTDSLTVIFTDESTGQIDSWKWDFGDKKTSTEQNPVHRYGRSGNYLVTLTVKNAISEDSTSQFVSVGFPDELEPVSAAFSVSGSSADELTAVFLDSSSGSVKSYSWDFGDGSKSGSQNPTHRYSKAGTYVVTLTVFGSAGDSDSTSQVIDVPIEDPEECDPEVEECPE